MILKDEAEKHSIKTTERDNSKDACEKIKQIKELLPNAVNSDNILNVQALQDVLDISKTTANNQGYELTFAGKGLAKAQKDSATSKELKTELNQSKNFDNTENVIIRGDNLDALKILKQNYKDKIKMIYIDPPYNTQSEEFIYNDNFTENEKALIEKYSLNEETVNYLHNIYGSKTHSGWLSFMYPRLSLARDLLKTDGVIFISIDDNEQSNLKILCDEIFGEENFVATIIWQKKFSPQNDATYFSNMHDFILCYAKKAKLSKNDNGWKRLLLKRDKIPDNYSNPDNDIRGPWISGDFTAEGPTENCVYEIISSNGTVYMPPKGKRWVYNKENYEKLRNEKRFWFGKDGNAFPRIKRFWSEVQQGIVPNTIWFHKDVGHTQEAKQETNKIFDVAVFDTPKPVRLIKHLLKISTIENELVLDFFAGSGTTAQAVMELNKEDGGNRKFILVQIDEKIDKNKSPSAYKFCEDNNFEPVISSITIERVNRAGGKIKEELSSIDVGYKVFSLVEKPRIDYKNGQIELLNKRDGALNVLYNMMSANCVELTEKIQEIEKDKIYLIKDCYYVIADCDLSKIDKTKAVYIDGYSAVSLEQWLNINNGTDDENTGVIY